MRLCWSSADITERRLSEAALRESESKYRTLFASIDEGFCIIEVVHRDDESIQGLVFREVNRAFFAHTGLADVVDRSVQEILPTYESFWVDMYEQVSRTGESLRTEDYVRDVDRWYDVHFSPIGGAGSRFVGVVFSDITARKRAEQALRESEERQSFLLRLSDTLRPLRDPTQIQGEAARILGEHLGLSRVFYAPVEPGMDGDDFVIHHEFRKPGAASIVGRFPVAGLGAQLFTEVQAGRTVVATDLQTQSLLSPAEFEIYVAFEAYAYIAVPLVKDGRFAALMTVHQDAPRAWTAGEIALVQEVAERLWEAVERARAEAALRESQSTLQSFFETAPFMMGIGEIEADHLIPVAANPTTAAFFGRSTDDMPGRMRAELGSPEPIEALWLDHLSTSQRTGAPVRFEYQEPRVAADGWLGAIVAIIGTGTSGRPRYSFIAEDITERKRQERASSLLDEISQALASLSTPDEMMEAVGRQVGDAMNLASCSFVDVDKERDEVTVHHGWSIANVPSLKQTFRMADYATIDFQQACRAGEPFIVRDTARDERVNAEAYAQLRVGAWVAVPFHWRGEWTAFLAVATREPREWRADEIGLLQEIANRVFSRLERVRAEERLRESEARYRTLFTSIDEGYARYEVLFDDTGEPVDARIHEVNPAYERLTGRHDPAGKLLSAVSPGLDPEWGAAMAEVVSTGQPLRFEGRNAEIDRWFDVFIGPMLGPGEPNIVLVLTDITERRRATVALRESEERFRLIVEQATDYAIFSTDPERRIETWSPGAETVFGWTAEEAIGHAMDMTYTASDRATGVPEQEAQQARESGNAPNDRWHRRNDGTLVFIEGATYARRSDDGDFRGLFKVGQDVTARLAAEEALREEEAVRREEEITLREELAIQVQQATAELRSLSRRLIVVQEEERRRLALELHDEIGQVLTGLGFQLAAATGKREEALREAQTTVSALTEQVRQLSLDLRPQVLDRYGLLAALEWYTERYQARTGITVHLRHQGLEQRLTSETEIAVFRVVQEALTNVARHSGSDFATVQLYGDDSLTLMIRDSGHGFDPAHAADTSGLGGMRERVELLGGRLDIESMPGGGTTIIAEIPLADEACAESGHTDQA